MLRLRRRPPVDRLRSEQRRRRGRWSRFVYLGVLLGLAIWLADLLLGPLVYFRSDGMVLARRAGVATEFAATVQKLFVREGDRVEAGQIVARVSSQEVAERIADLAARLAQVQSELSTLHIRGEVLGKLQEAVAGRARVSQEAKDALEELHRRRLLPLNERSSAYEQAYRSQVDHETLRAEQKAVEAERALLQPRLKEAEEALADLRAHYSGGEVRASIGGVVGRIHAAEGSVLRLGETFMDLYGDDRFVLAYVPSGAFYSVAEGERVTLRSGLKTFAGVVERVEPIAAALPHEFQRTFQPVERARVLRIAIAAADTPPLFTTVRVRSGEGVLAALSAVLTAISDGLTGHRRPESGSAAFSSAGCPADALPIPRPAPP